MKLLNKTQSVFLLIKNTYHKSDVWWLKYLFLIHLQYYFLFFKVSSDSIDRYFLDTEETWTKYLCFLNTECCFLAAVSQAFPLLLQWRLLSQPLSTQQPRTQKSEPSRAKGHLQKKWVSNPFLQCPRGSFSYFKKCSKIFKKFLKQNHFTFSSSSQL